MNISKLKIRLIAQLGAVCCLMGVGSRIAQAQSPTNTLFVANTTCTSCAAVPPVGLNPGVGAAVPSSDSFTGNLVTLNGINFGGAVGKFGGGNGGPTGWIHVTYTIPEGTLAGNYTLQFEVSHAGDTNYASALAIDHIVSPSFNESFEDDGILPPGWTLSGGSAGFSGFTGGGSSSIPNLPATDGSFFAWITNGCQTGDLGNPNGCTNTLASVPTGYGSLYQGPGTNGLPPSVGLGSPTLGTTLQSPTFTLNPGDTISFDVNFLTSDGTYGFPDFATAQLVLISLTGGTITNTSLVQNFDFNTQIGFDFDYSTAFNAGTITLGNNPVPRITDQGVSPSNYLAMVAGTALAETTCLVDPGQLDLGGSPSCPELTIQCTTDGITFAGDICPQSTQRNMFFRNVISTSQPNIPAGSAPTMAMGSDNWSPANCVLEGAEQGQLCPKSESTAFTDCCSGIAMITHSNSTFIAGCCEREWNTTPAIHLWSKSTTVPVSFTSAPPPLNNPPNTSPINNFTPAPGEMVTFGFESPGAAPDPTYPIAGDQTLINPIPPSGHPEAPCGNASFPLLWAPGTLPPGFTTNTGSVVIPGEGAWELHYFSTDCADMEELVYNPLNGANNWAMFKTTPFNVDLTAPTVTGLSLSNASPLPGTMVTATYNCGDPISHGVASGLISCGTYSGLGGVLSVGPVTSTFTVPAGANGPQTYSVTATDRAGNSSTSIANYSAGYEFEGFFAPVSNAPFINKIEERTIVPLIFQIEKGSEVVVNGLKLAPSNGGTGTVSLSATNSGVCSTHVIASSLTIKSAFNSGLVGLGGGFYLFAWQVNVPEGACLDMALNLGDGVLHHAIFQTK